MILKRSNPSDRGAALLRLSTRLCRDSIKIKQVSGMSPARKGR
jgi:hypothetical protein